MHVYEELEFSPLFHRQVKDQNKKVASLKHKEQVEKKKSAQMLEEARRREDTLSDSSQQLQVGRGLGGGAGGGGEPGPAGPSPQACGSLRPHPLLFFLLTLPATFLSVQLFSSKGVAFNRKGQFYSTALLRKPEQGRKSVSWRESACLVSSVSTG